MKYGEEKYWDLQRVCTIVARIGRANWTSTNWKWIGHIFIDTFKSLFYVFLVRNSTNNFVDLLATSERMEKGIQKGKFVVTLTKVVNPKKFTALGKKKEGKVYTVVAKTSKPKSYWCNDSNYLPPQPTWLGYYPPLAYPPPYSIYP